MRQFFLILSTLGILICASCHDDPPVIYPTIAPLDMNKLALGPGDKLNLTVFYGSHSIQAAYTLDNSGQISVQFIGAVEANGKTLDEVREEIKRRLADGYLNDPIVSLTLTELNSLTLSVSGMVAKTGAVKFSPGITITEVIAQSGGFTFFVSFLPYPSSAFVPVATMPGWIQGFARHQPVTVVVETLRGLLLDIPGRPSVQPAILWCVAILLASMGLSAVLFRRRTK